MAKKVQYFTGLLYFSKFDKCCNRPKKTGLFFNRPITVAPYDNVLILTILHHVLRGTGKIDQIHLRNLPNTSFQINVADTESRTSS